MFQSNIVIFKQLEIDGNIWFQHYQLDPDDELNIEPYAILDLEGHSMVLGEHCD